MFRNQKSVKLNFFSRNLRLNFLKIFMSMNLKRETNKFYLIIELNDITFTSYSKSSLASLYVPFTEGWKHNKIFYREIFFVNL